MVRKLLVGVAAYVTAAGAIWGLFEAYTYFEGDRLRSQIGAYWPLLFWVVPIVPALVAVSKVGRDKSGRSEHRLGPDPVAADRQLPGGPQPPEPALAAEAELITALRDWLGGLYDYERSAGAMTGSASDSGLIPKDSKMAIQLANYEDVRARTWSSVREYLKGIIERTEETFLGFMAHAYAGIYNHEVYADLLPSGAATNARLARLMTRPTGTVSYADCQKAYRVLQLNIEKNRAATGALFPPLLGRTGLYCGVVTMQGVERDGSDQTLLAPARPLGDSVLLEFDVTNSNVLDLRIVRLYVRVGEYRVVDILDLYTGDAGGGMPVREFTCDIEPWPGVFGCSSVSKDFGYIRLSYGELETFSIEVRARVPGLYRFVAGLDYSAGGETGSIEAEDDVKELVFYDPELHQPRWISTA